MRFPDPLGGEGTRLGLWALALPAAALVPVFVCTALAHRNQWPVGDVEPWQGWIIPWSWRLWAAVMALLVAGLAASLSPADPRASRQILLALGRAGLAVCTSLLAALPGAVWLVRLGVASAGTVAGKVVPAAGVVALGAATAAVLGVRLPLLPAALGGVAAAWGALWLWIP